MRKWAVLNSAVVIENWPYHRTRQDRVRLHNGDAITYYVQEHPDWVNAVVLTPRRQIVLVRQYRHAVGDFVLEVPGGMVEPGEEPAAAIVREVSEETGYVSPLAPICLGSFWPNPAVQTNRVVSFLLLDAAPGSPLHPDRTEDLERVEMTWDRYGELMAQGELPHLFSAVTYYRAREYLSRRRGGERP
jgi:ADP-ribose pyrophosphatase